MIYEKIRKDFDKALKEKNKEHIKILRLAISEFQRRPNPHEIISDKDVISILSKLINSENELKKYNKEPDQIFINVLSNYIPVKLDKNKIEEWILTYFPNISEIENNKRMVYMKQIMKELGTSADGNVVKDVLLSF